MEKIIIEHKIIGTVCGLVNSNDEEQLKLAYEVCKNQLKKSVCYKSVSVNNLDINNLRCLVGVSLLNNYNEDFPDLLKDRILNSVYNLFTLIKQEYIKQNSREFSGAMYKLTNYFLERDIKNNDLSEKTLDLYYSIAQKDVNIRENNLDELEDKMAMAITKFENYNNVTNSL